MAFLNIKTFTSAVSISQSSRSSPHSADPQMASPPMYLPLTSLSTACRRSQKGKSGHGLCCTFPLLLGCWIRETINIDSLVLPKTTCNEESPRSSHPSHPRWGHKLQQTNQSPRPSGKCIISNTINFHWTSPAGAPCPGRRKGQPPWWQSLGGSFQSSRCREKLLPWNHQFSVPPLQKTQNQRTGGIFLLKKWCVIFRCTIFFTL